MMWIIVMTVFRGNTSKLLQRRLLGVLLIGLILKEQYTFSRVDRLHCIAVVAHKLFFCQFVTDLIALGNQQYGQQGAAFFGVG